MTKITNAVRATIRQSLVDSPEYDADTMRIGRDGVVSALKDADKTYAGNDPRRYYLGSVGELLRNRAIEAEIR